MMELHLLRLVLVTSGLFCHAEELRVPEAQTSNPCIGLETCSDCLRTANVCAWCSSVNLPRTTSRCNIYEQLLSTCTNSIVWLKSSVNVTKNDKVRGSDKDQQPIQVQPQVLDITTRPNDPVTFSLTFRQAENYPVDLYFLLDLSYTMVKEEKAQKNLVALGRDILPSLENITKNFHLGFGTFVDKFVMPYIPWTDQMLKNRCPLKESDQTCRKPHDFINQLPLSEDVAKFAPKMEEAIKAVSQSFDDSEGGMDGLMQTLACEKDVGWRERSRRIVVYASNSLFHLAGDGLFGGAAKMYDGNCHLNAEQSYNPADNIYDYPSVSQIAAKLRDKSTNIIFAVMPNVVSHYKRLENILSGSSVGTLESQSENIIQLIRDNYDKLRSKIEFVPRKADDVEFTFKSKCLEEILKETDSCDGLEIKDSVTFNVTMTVTTKACEGHTGVIERSVDIAAVGLAEKLTINLKIACDCDCEGPSVREQNSTKCSNGQGTFECGICKCNPGRHGRECECDETKISSEESFSLCRANQNDSLICTGHGECVCGECRCFSSSSDSGRRYSGQYCECDDLSCPRSSDDSSLCGGPGRGRCVCGNCECLNMWSGPACDCSTDNSTCMASNGLECNNQGVCECGRCLCNSDSQYIGPTCEECPSCPSRCTQYRDCAECRGFNAGKYGPEECKEKCPEVIITDVLEEEGGRIRKCNFRDTDECLFYFTYVYDENNNVVIKVQKNKDCPEEVNVAMIVGLVVAGIVLIPLLALCIFIFIRNRRDAAEYAEFLREKERTKWETGANPIYKDPQCTFENPTFHQ
ncbi:LOW QUALITY PROTEIN: integrin beta-1-A-like [Pomacea canaliculata]|uniref:LOW QUALITY PROTEIN: integrin beta-1-A-like n=1 Tax=Pomacea canaliculata TaxID=400727 RepID=UPI000D73FE49|nr:LOW QUALITY PROTEIN: integrin beta-1-A-like [Pomacea canaliculata]